MLKKIKNKVGNLKDQIVETITSPFKTKPMFRFDIINALIKHNKYTSYLEIGVRNPDECFNFIECELKHGVDPGLEADFKVDFPLTSDDFFAQNTRKYDCIFIDGLHIDDQVRKDIINSLGALNPGGTVVLHDCNPPDLHHAREDYYDFNTPATVYWNGTVWKAIVDFRSSEWAKKYECRVVDTDYGIGLIQASESSAPIANDNPFYAFRKFEEKRSYYLGLISIKEFKKLYLNG